MQDYVGNTLYEGDEIIYVRKTGCNRHQAVLSTGIITEIFDVILKVNNDKGYIRPQNVILKKSIKDEKAK